MVFQVAKPGIPWVEIAGRYQRGEKSREICKDYDISRQAIEARATKGHWGRAAIDSDDELQEKYADEILSLPSISNQTDPQTHSESQIANHAKRSPANMAIILDSVTRGMSLTRSAHLAGINKKTLDAWVASDERLDALIHTHQRGFELEMLRDQILASNRGDWKASAHLLSMSEKSSYAAVESEGKGGITVILNVPIPKPEGITIEHD